LAVEAIAPNPKEKLTVKIWLAASPAKSRAVAA
jgi:hypothetical protein